MKNITDKTILVTGATGFLGGALAKRLASEGATVKALARRPDRDRYIKDVPGIEIVSGDITDAAQMETVMQGCDLVFHVAAALSGNLNFQRNVNVAGTRNVARAAATASVERFIHVSTIAVYGHPITGTITEDTPFTDGNVPYNVSKGKAEIALQGVADDHSLAYSIIRPGMIYGSRSSAWTHTMFRVAKRRPTMWIGDGSGTVPLIFVDDVVDMMLLLATHPQATGEAFNCVYDPPSTWRDYLGGYAALAGHDNWLAVPPLLTKGLAPFLEIVMKLRAEPQDLPALVRYITGNAIYSMEKAKSLLGWQPQIALSDGIERCVPYLREKGLLE